MNKVIFRNF